MSEPKHCEHIRLNHVERLAGVTLGWIQSGAIGKLAPSGFYDSSEEVFHIVTPQLWSAYFTEAIDLKQTGLNSNRPDFLVVIHPDLTADAYVGCLPIKLGFRAKRNLKGGEPIQKSDFADVTDCYFQGNEIRPEDSIVFCFRMHWRFGIYYDFGPSAKNYTRSNDDLAQALGAAFRHLMFFEEYSGYLEGASSGVLDDGWFPFIELLGKDFCELVSMYRDIDQREALLEGFLKRFTSDRLNGLASSWWEDANFESKKELILAGIEQYLNNTQAGTIAALKILYSEIEGLLRIQYCAEKGTNSATFSQLLTYVENKGNAVFHTRSLAFPAAFYQYLKEQIFAGFDISTGQVPISRHSTSHGVAPVAGYTRQRALQAILTLDQLWRYLNSKK